MKTKNDMGAKRSLLLLLVRLIRFFHKEDQFIPQLRSVPDGKVLPNRLYRHFGRILVSHSNPIRVQISFYYAKVDNYGLPLKGRWHECTELRYNEALQNHDEITRYEQTGAPCDRCACQIYGLPCHCAFRGGSMTGYFELLHCNKQYSNNLTV